MSIQSTYACNSFYKLPEQFYTPSDTDTLEALKANDTEKLKELLAQGANPNALLTLDESAMEKLVEGVMGGSAEAESNPFASFLMYLVFSEIFSEGTIPPLFFAAYVSNVEAVKVLIEAGADVHFKVVVDDVAISPFLIDSGDEGALLEIMEILHQSGLAIEEMVDTDYASVTDLLQEAQKEGNHELVAFLENHGYSLTF